MKQQSRWSLLFPTLILLTLTLLYLSSLLLPKTPSPNPNNPSPPPKPCDLFRGRWIHDPFRRPLYDATCPFHRNSWNCLRNGRHNMTRINSFRWAPAACPSAVPAVDPEGFLRAMRGRRIGFVGDSLNENFLVAFLCVLRSADGGARKWKRKGAWRGGYFPRFDVTVAYHRAVLLARYKWQPENDTSANGVKGIYRVDVDIPADDWINVTKFYDVLLFNTGHWWGPDKFPDKTPLVFYREGKPVIPPLGISDGLRVVLNSIIPIIEREVPRTTLKFWRMQSPRHFHGGEWNQNGSCLFDHPLDEIQLDSWFDPKNGGVNKEAREVNHVIEQAIRGTSIRLLDFTHLSEFRADAHPAIWLGKKDAVAVWGQDCLHWCLPGVPDTWVELLATLILQNIEND
ncbi:hypothetical protein QJS04_geneDACA006456 [Acorus gramineus]|uniref:Trichome birefringence-like N-terminal domain-containing protein n=1 Tax=Acorus gramineus TaxID=55184 RepID=A0AAV9AZZ7_ACOGR|nr:hypothetical protein QJS04_geneDACA006456 [Acorus gramineus]